METAQVMNTQTMRPPVADVAGVPRYDAVYRVLHWSMAGIFITAVVLGFWASLLPSGTSPRRELLVVHKSLGAMVFVLALMRLTYRLTHAPPAYPAVFSRLIRVASSVNHWVLYALMLAMPITGYVNSAAGGAPLQWFWLFDMPRLLTKNVELAHLSKQMHAALAWAVYLVLAAHVGATIWHSAIKRDGTLARMTGRGGPAR